MDKENQKRTLQIIQTALRSQERKKNQEEAQNVVKKTGPSGYQPPLKQPGPDEQNFNKEENEEIMEGLMNKIVVNPSFVNDERLNAKIENVLGMDAF